MSFNPRHVPVLHREVMQILGPAAGDCVLDCTLGLAGHARLFADAVGNAGRLIGLDADPENFADAKAALAGVECGTELHQANFRDLLNLALPSVDILFADLGLSSPHLDEPSRGFSFRAEGPLDLRFDRTAGVSGAQWIERSDEEALVSIFREYGELRDARRIARSLKEKEIHTTTDVVAAVERACGWRAPSQLPQVFQSLRIAVNDELSALRSLLEAIPVLLKPGGRAGIISFHSLEDRMVKQAFVRMTTPEKNPETGAVSVPAPFERLTKKAVVASDEEIANNPRARSARLRVIRRQEN